jgi:hypothetical protein
VTCFYVACNASRVFPYIGSGIWNLEHNQRTIQMFSMDDTSWVCTVPLSPLSCSRVWSLVQYNTHIVSKRRKVYDRVLYLWVHTASRLSSDPESGPAHIVNERRNVRQRSPRMLPSSSSLLAIAGREGTGSPDLDLASSARLRKVHCRMGPYFVPRSPPSITRPKSTAAI